MLFENICIQNITVQYKVIKIEKIEYITINFESGLNIGTF